MAHHVGEKLKKANAVGFVRYPKNWLIVYDNWPLPSFDRAKAATRLSAQLAAMGAYSVFDAVFVLAGSTLIEFRPADTRHAPITRRA